MYLLSLIYEHTVYTLVFLFLSVRLLDVIACRKDPAGLKEGTVLVDGKVVTSDIRLSSAYVVQVSSSKAGFFFFQKYSTDGCSSVVLNYITFALPGWRSDGNSVSEREPSVQCQPATGPKGELVWRKKQESHFNHTRSGTGRLRRH